MLVVQSGRESKQSKNGQEERLQQMEVGLGFGPSNFIQMAVWNFSSLGLKIAFQFPPGSQEEI